MTDHHLKCWPEFFQPTIDGRKTFDFRYGADRQYRVGDWLTLLEWDPETKAFTGRVATFEVSYVMHDGPLVPTDMWLLGLRRSRGRATMTPDADSTTKAEYIQENEVLRLELRNAQELICDRARQLKGLHVVLLQGQADYAGCIAEYKVCAERLRKEQARVERMSGLIDMLRRQIGIEDVHLENPESACSCLSCRRRIE